MFESIIGLATGWHKMEYTWRDVALYALAIGSSGDDLPYIYEKYMKTIPSFGVLPYFNSLLTTPQQPSPYPGNVMAAEQMSQEIGHPVPPGLHMGHEIIVHRPISPIKGSLLYNDEITQIYDRGADKGAIVETTCKVYDESGQPLCTNTSKGHIQTVGGWGGLPPPKTTVLYPERAPDYARDIYVPGNANALYRLTGDTNYIHIDPAVAKKAGLEGVIMQGLSSFGYACLQCIQAVIPYEPERMTRMAAQFRTPAYPGRHTQVQIWRAGDGKASFRYLDTSTGKAILDNGEFTWK